MSLQINGNKGYVFKVKDKIHFQAAYPPDPNEYEEIDFIRLNQQYVDTGIKIGTSHIFELKWKKTVNKTVHTYGYYSGTSGTDNFTLYSAEKSENTATLRYNSTSLSISGSKLNNTDIHTINVSADGYILDNNDLVAITDETEFTTTGNVYIGGVNLATGATTSYNKFEGNVYYCKIWEGETLVADFIPVKRLIDEKEYLYDKITENFFPINNF